MLTQAKSFTPASIRGLSKITNPIAGLKPWEARLPSHNKISSVAESKGEKSEEEGWGEGESKEEKDDNLAGRKRVEEWKKLIWGK